MKKLSLYIGVVIIATVLSPTLVFASVWEIEIVDSGGWITLPSLAIDSLDKVHIIYSGDYELKYATNFLGSWAIESVACIGGGYENEKLATSLALDSNDKVYMGYYGCDGDGNRYPKYQDLFQCSGLHAAYAREYFQWPVDRALHHVDGQRDHD